MCLFLRQSILFFTLIFLVGTMLRCQAWPVLSFDFKAPQDSQSALLTPDSTENNPLMDNYWRAMEKWKSTQSLHLSQVDHNLSVELTATPKDLVLTIHDLQDKSKIFLFFTYSILRSPHGSTDPD